MAINYWGVNITFGIQLWDIIYLWLFIRGKNVKTNRGFSIIIGRK